jgi:NADPH:quinone reductase-like Zn-dependent oxidoreductase
LKAIVQEQYGSPDALHLQEIEKPQVGEDNVLVHVLAASAHIGDWHVMTGLPYPFRIVNGLRGPKAPVRGTDFAGRIEVVGANVVEFQPGDEVFGLCRGSFAETAIARLDKIAPKPTNLTFEQAATVPTSALTALQGLRDAGRAQPGQTVLIIGAAGGVGSFAVQIAKAFGAHVTGVCSAKKVDLVRSIGADEVIDYTEGDFTSTGRNYDLILDTAGNRALSQLRQALAPRGTLVIVGAEGGGKWFGTLSRNMRALALSPFVGQRLALFITKARGKDLLVLKELIEAGKVAPVIDQTFSLAEVPEAIRYLEQGHARGKIVISMGATSDSRL